MKKLWLIPALYLSGLLILSGSSCATNPAPDPGNPAASVRDPIPGTPPAGLPDRLARFRKTNLTFFIGDLTTKNTQEKQIQFITDAFNRWGAVTPLNFTRTTDRAQSDLFVGFGTGTHCQLYVQSNLTCPTDGAFDATTLGHGYFPDGPSQGQFHMNDAQDWSDDRLLFSTLVHEIGHNLGLDHLPQSTAVMFASDNGQTGDLTQADIDAVQRLYGSRDGTVKPTQAGAPPANDGAANRTAPVTSLPDADGDGLDDATELFVLGTNSQSADSDNDGVADGIEVENGLDAMDSDTDGDGSNDGDEFNGDGNAFLPDSGLTGDVTPFLGKYAGTDSVGAPIEFTVNGDGSVTGKLFLTQYGFEEDVELIGAAGGDGRVELVSFDYFFEYKGTILAGAVGNGTWKIETGSTGTWSATKSASPSAKLTGAAARGFRAVTAPDGSIQLEPLHRPDQAEYLTAKQ